MEWWVSSITFVVFFIWAAAQLHRMESDNRERLDGMFSDLGSKLDDLKTDLDELKQR
jgi:hypothetical protein